MEKITGIKSVDFKVTASGHGVVNWNGSTEVQALIDGEWKKLKNHNMPKLRGYTNRKEIVNDKGEKYFGVKEASDVNFIDNPLYISQNCIRYHLFRDDVINWQHPKLHENVDNILCSMTGLVRGYVIPKNENKRTSALLLTDFVDKACNGNYEQMGRSGSKEKQATKSGTDKSTSMFSKTTFGKTKYVAFGSISIEQLQFISLSHDYGQEAMVVTKNKDGEELAKKLESFIKSLDFASGEVTATYHNNYVRQGTVFADGQKGILLNNAAIDALVKQTLSMVENLGFRQGKGYMVVDSIEVDYNDFNNPRDMMRIVKTPELINPQKKGGYAVYYKES